MADDLQRTDDAALIETRLDGEQLLKGRFLDVRRDRVQLPDGAITTREYIVHPGAVMILPVFDDGRVLVERQFRYPVDQVVIEYPAGKLDPNENSVTCGRRELKEETGYSAKDFFFITRIHPVFSYSTEFIDLYLAKGLTAGERHLDEHEFLDIFTADIGQMFDWIRSGRITDVKTIIGTFWLEKILNGSWPLGEPAV
ncbi:NUDIX domain-containing protein [Pararobbsia silviterrae]|uniref:GDP-mannose pyrophosphatase n=1 Tax=Pararobbsia silviterrae TaxID=1792498 RepID=A0A494Y466_9BURK|nr:NUDIX hydrolase [Pararobbsia silviterrae]RKP57471.1 NUDIX hydrolase [Pararobbsia silviterrae]